MIVKKHVSQEGQTILAVCDSDLIGKKFEENEKQLDLTTSFYKGEEMSEQELKQILPEANIINLVGKKSIQFGINHKIITQDNIITIQNIPHAQCLIIKQE